MLVAHVCLRNFSTFTVNLLKFNNSDVSTMLLFAAHICTVQFLIFYSTSMYCTVVHMVCMVV